MERQTEQKILKILEREKRKGFARNEMNHVGGFLKLALLEFTLIVGIVLVGMYVFQLLNPSIINSFGIRVGVGFMTLIVELILTKKFVQIHMWGCDKFGINDWDWG